MNRSNENITGQDIINNATYACPCCNSNNISTNSRSNIVGITSTCVCYACNSRWEIYYQYQMHHIIRDDYHE